MSPKEIYELAWRVWGRGQYVIAIEELSELQKAICKYLRYLDIDPEAYDIEADMIDEMVDVEIMLEQLKNIHCYDKGYFDKKKMEKLQRLEGRLSLIRQ